MRYMLIVLFSAASCIGRLWAQNLVPNPSFEEYTECPNEYGQVDLVQRWFSGYSSPDYYNTCDGQGMFGVPTNVFGFQQPVTGNAYTGIWGYSAASPGLGEHELLGIRLSEALELGQTYWASFKVSWTTGYPFVETRTGYASDHIGVLLSKDSIYNEAGWLPWPDHAQFYSTTVVTDSVGWTVISGHFVADSAYTYLYVGCFFGDDQVNVIQMQKGADDFSYYYVDDVCLSTDPAFCPLGTGIVEADNGHIVLSFDTQRGGVSMVGLSTGKYSVFLCDVSGRILFNGSVTSNASSSDVFIPLQRTDQITILRLTGGGREWHWKLPPIL